MIRVLHTADLHLDNTFAQDDPKFSALRRAQQRSLFASIMLYARSQNADLLFFCGDLIDRAMPEPETKNLILREFENTPETEIFVCPGRNDACRPGSFWADTRFPQNVHVFRSERLERVTVERLNADIYGYAFCHRDLARNPFAVMPTVDKSKYNLICGCGSIGGEDFCPVTAEEIAHSGADYIALGGDHAASELLIAGGTYYAVAGCPEGLDFDDPGYKGLRLVAMEKSGELLLKSKCVRLSARRFERCVLRLDGSESKDSVREKIAAHIREAALDGDSFLEVVLEGRVPVSFRFARGDLGKLTEKVGYLRLTDRTVMVYAQREGEKESFQTVFARKVAEKCGDEALRSEILKCGFAALEKKE